MADPARRPDEGASLGPFELRLSLDPPDDGQAAVGGPIGFLHPLEQLPRRAAREWRPGQRSVGYRAPEKAPVERERELPRRRDREDVGRWKGNRRRLASVRALGKDAEGLAAPGGAVDDRLAVLREPSGQDGPAAEREPPIARPLRRSRCRQTPDYGAERRRHEHRGRDGEGKP